MASALHPAGTKVLVVDDDPIVRAIAALSLSGAGFAVCDADCAEAALAAVSRPASIDLLVSDVVMPRVNGVQLARELITRVPDLRVLLISGNCALEVVEHEIFGSGMAFLAKPFLPETLLQKVQEVLAAPPPRRHEPLWVTRGQR
ncbi:MAG: response regulator [Deltaproteobacteria bacterium]|nr:response regulator [Deltaproteobacteria bacterium]